MFLPSPSKGPSLFWKCACPFVMIFYFKFGVTIALPDGSNFKSPRSPFNMTCWSTSSRNTEDEECRVADNDADAAWSWVSSVVSWLGAGAASNWVSCISWRNYTKFYQKSIIAMPRLQKKKKTKRFYYFQKPLLFL